MVLSLLYGGAAFGQAPVILYDADAGYVSSTKNMSRAWQAGTHADAVVVFDDDTPLNPASGYTGPDIYGAASIAVSGTLDGVTAAGVNLGACRARVRTDQIEIMPQSDSLTTTNGHLYMTAAALLYFKAPSLFELGDSSLEFTLGYNTHLSSFRWIVQDETNRLYVSDIVHVNRYGAFKHVISGNLTSRRWAVFDPSVSDDLYGAPLEYRRPADLGMDCTRMRGAGVLIRHKADKSGSGSLSLNGTLNRFAVYARDAEREHRHLRAYYFGNSLTDNTMPQWHGDLGRTTDKVWTAVAKLGAGWQLWQHRYEIYVGGALDPGDNGDLTIDPEQIGESSSLIQQFVGEPWEAMVLQPFGDQLSDVQTNKWGTEFPEPTDVGDVQSAADIMDVLLTNNPAAKVYIYINWPPMEAVDELPPEEDWPPWTVEYMAAHSEMRNAEFPDRSNFCYQARWYRFYQYEDRPWMNGRHRARDYYYKMFQGLIDRYPALWAEGRLVMIPVADIWNELDFIFEAGGDPETDNTNVTEKIHDITDFYTDVQHVRKGLPRFVNAASFYAAMFEQHPGGLVWTQYNDAEAYGDDPHHDKGELLLITSNRAELVIDVIWDVMHRHPFSVLREPIFSADDPGMPGMNSLWGDNAYGQVGMEHHADPATNPAPLDRGMDVTVGGEFAFARRPDGAVLGWGRNHRGQLGDATFVSRAYPLRPVYLPPVEMLACGADHAAGITSEGEVWCWGANDHGQLGDDYGRFGHMTNEYPVPPENGRPRAVSGLPTGAVQAACGDGFTLARLADGTVWGWGRNDAGQMGRGYATNIGSSAPAAVIGPSNVADIAAGADFAAAVEADGRVWTWGGNARGQLGDGTQADTSAPVIVSGVTNVIRAAAGSNHVLAVSASGVLYGWGDNTYGQLAENPAIISLRTSPQTIDPGLPVDRAAAGARHSLALLNNGALYAWGGGAHGQLGDGGTNTSWAPQPAPGMTNVETVCAAGYQSGARTVAPWSFARWQEHCFSALEISRGDADGENDVEGDDTDNLLEYAYGMNPRIADASNRPAVTLTNGCLTLRFRRDARASDMTYRVQVCGSLLEAPQRWSNTVTAAGAAAPEGDGFIAEDTLGDLRTVTGRDTTPASNAVHRFIRLSLERTP